MGMEQQKVIKSGSRTLIPWRWNDEDPRGTRHWVVFLISRPHCMPLAGQKQQQTEFYDGQVCLMHHFVIIILGVDGCIVT